MKDESKPKLLTLDHLVKPQKFCMDDFTTCDLIGEGTYGKVFKCALSQRLVDSLVGTHDWTDSFKAMKSIKFENDKDGFPITALREI
jgi:cyclin-dependent kinase 12/13